MYTIIKRIFDITAAIILIIIFAPVYVLASVFIYAQNRGNVIYKQRRTGKNGRTFMIYKFRTMIDNAEPDGPVWAADNDSRVTKTGRILRELGIDEIPQLYNVIINDMSIIGPRPERPYFTDKFKTEIDGYTERHSVKPGITGLSQIIHGSDHTIEDVKRKLKLDLLYIKKKSFMLDVYIMLLTFGLLTSKLFPRFASKKSLYFLTKIQTSDNN